MKKLISKFHNNKAPPGLDLIIAYWVKYSTSLKKFLATIYEKSIKKEIQFPSWLITTRIILTAKNQFSFEAKNYKPITCQNILYKLYTGIIASFIEDHCIENNIITQEQTGAKKGSWGCQDQLMIYKAVLEDAKKNRKNLFCIWIDYQKAFDSVSHKW